MPEIIVELAEGRTVEVKRALVREITDAGVRVLGGEPDTVLVIIHDNPQSGKGRGGVLYSDR